jgi:hypothetical protein
LLISHIDGLKLLFVIWLSVNVLNCNARERFLLFRSAGPEKTGRVGPDFFRQNFRAQTGPTREHTVTDFHNSPYLVEAGPRSVLADIDQTVFLPIQRESQNPSTGAITKISSENVQTRKQRNERRDKSEEENGLLLGLVTCSFLRHLQVSIVSSRRRG